LTDHRYLSQGTERIFSLYTCPGSGDKNSSVFMFKKGKKKRGCLLFPETAS
jgi:hypothetical protein